MCSEENRRLECKSIYLKRRRDCNILCDVIPPSIDWQVKELCKLSPNLNKHAVCCTPSFEELHGYWCLAQCTKPCLLNWLRMFWVMLVNANWFRIWVFVRYGISSSTTQPNVGRGRKSLMEKKRGCRPPELWEWGFVTAGLWLQLVCCAWVSSQVVPNLRSHSEPIRREWRVDVLMRCWVSPRELWGFGNDREGRYSARSGTSQIDSEWLLSSGLWLGTTMSIVLFGVLSPRLT